MKYWPLFAISAALCLTGCVTTYSPANVQSYEAGPVIKLTSNDAAPSNIAIAVTEFETEPKKQAKKKKPVKTIVSKPVTPLSVPVTGLTRKPDVKVTKANIKTPLSVIASQKSYKRLEYGAEKPLVCKEPFLPKGKLKGRPNLQVMWENYLYPRPEGIWSEIGGYVEINGNLPHDKGRWTNACTIRLSHMLNKAGYKIPQRFGVTSSGANKDQYIYRLSDMEDYLIEILGEPDHVMKGESTRWYNLPNVPGIVLIDFPGHNSFTGHTTVWNGAGTVDGSDTVGDKVLFWELPCFIPKNRKDDPEMLVGEAVNANGLSALP